MPSFVLFIAAAWALAFTLGEAAESFAANGSPLTPHIAQSCPAPLLICRHGRIGPTSCFDPSKYLCDAGRLHPLGMNRGNAANAR
jgi:hypothetical protein